MHECPLNGSQLTPRAFLVSAQQRRGLGPGLDVGLCMQMRASWVRMESDVFAPLHGSHSWAALPGEGALPVKWRADAKRGIK